MARQLILVGVAVVLTGCGGVSEQPHWPGTVAFSAERTADTGLDLYVQRPGKSARRLTSGPTNEFSPSWGPDASWLAYRVNPPKGDEGDIWRMRRDGSEKRNLTRSPRVSDWSPAVSPDGRRIALMSSRSGSHEVWIMRSDGTSARQVTHANELSEYPTWSPDGTTLAYGANRSGNFEIARIAADGSGEEEILTDDPSRDQWPAWSPDGEWIAFMSDRDGKEDVFVMRPDGTDQQNVTSTPDLFETHPAWTADGRLTYYQHAEGPVHVRVDPLGDGKSYTLPIDGSFVFDWTS